MSVVAVGIVLVAIRVSLVVETNRVLNGASMLFLGMISAPSMLDVFVVVRERCMVSLFGENVLVIAVLGPDMAVANVVVELA
jgi:hypothetical protein